MFNISPQVIFIFFFIIPFSLVYVPFVSIFKPPSNTLLTLVIYSSVAYFSGVYMQCYVTKILPKKKASTAIESIKKSNSFSFLFAFFIIGTVCLFYEFYILGGPPILLDDLEQARLNLMVNGYIHLLAINLGMVGGVSLFIYRLSKDKRLLMLGLASFCFIFLTGNRSDMMIPIIFLIIALVSSGQMKIKAKQVVMIVILFFIVGAIKHFRDLGQDGADYLMMVGGQLSGNVNILSLLFYPLYMTFTYNFVIFDRIIDIIQFNPDYHTYGYYTFYSVVTLLPVDKVSFGDYKNALMGVDFYSGLTTSYISNLYVDFGSVGVVIGSFFLGFIASLCYERRVKIAWLLLYSIIATRYTLLFYVFPFEQFYAIWQVFFILLYSKFCVRKIYG